MLSSVAIGKHTFLGLTQRLSSCACAVRQALYRSQLYLGRENNEQLCNMVGFQESLARP
jgi:hypothetical protein